MTAVLLNNRYQILETLGRGGFGETFLAIDTHMPSARKCVIKQLKPVVQTPQTPQWLQERFQREATVLEALGEKHPQIPKLYAYFSEGGNFYLVQEWIEGLTLSQQQQQQGNLSASQVRDILLKLLPILEFVHSHRLIHRDIKPDNIILRSLDQQPVLIDFGVIKETMSTMMSPDGRTTYSVVLGTPGYMPSEQAAGRPVYSSDLYSLGLTAIFLLTGKTPQMLETDSRTGEIAWRQDAPDVDFNLASVIDRSICFHPRDRFASAKEMMAALQTKTAMPTGATLVVAPAAKLSRSKPASSRTPTVMKDFDEQESENSWLPWLLIPLLILGVMAGAFVLGFNLLSPKQQELPTPSPSDIPEQPEPQTFPTPESPRPRPRPRRTATPIPEASPSPEPQVSPSFVPEASPSPEPQVSPSPVPEVSPSPEPQVSPSSAPEASPSPPLSPSPLPSPSPSPVAPQPSPVTPETNIPPGQPMPKKLPANTPDTMP